MLNILALDMCFWQAGERRDLRIQPKLSKHAKLRSIINESWSCALVVRKNLGTVCTNKNKKSESWKWRWMKKFTKNLSVGMHWIKVLSIKWKHLPRYWPYVRGIHWSLVVPLTNHSDAELWCFLWSAPQKTVEQTIETQVILDAIELIMTSIQWSISLSDDIWCF